MERKKIYFDSVESALYFVRSMEPINATIKLISGTRTVDGKSLIGVFSLDLSKPVFLEITGDSQSRQAAFHAIRKLIRA